MRGGGVRIDATLYRTGGGGKNGVYFSLVDLPQQPFRNQGFEIPRPAITFQEIKVCQNSDRKFEVMSVRVGENEVKQNEEIYLSPVMGGNREVEGIGPVASGIEHIDSVKS